MKSKANTCTRVPFTISTAWCNTESAPGLRPNYRPGVAAARREREERHAEPGACHRHRNPRPIALGRTSAAGPRPQWRTAIRLAR